VRFEQQRYWQERHADECYAYESDERILFATALLSLVPVGRIIATARQAIFD
jgi:hypothetical protein